MVNALEHDREQKVRAAKFHSVQKGDQASHGKRNVLIEADVNKGLCSAKLRDDKSYE